MDFCSPSKEREMPIVKRVFNLKSIYLSCVVGIESGLGASWWPGCNGDDITLLFFVQLVFWILKVGNNIWNWSYDVHMYCMYDLFWTLFMVSMKLKLSCFQDLKSWFIKSLNVSNDQVTIKFFRSSRCGCGAFDNRIFVTNCPSQNLNARLRTFIHHNFILPSHHIIIIILIPNILEKHFSVSCTVLIKIASSHIWFFPCRFPPW